MPEQDFTDSEDYHTLMRAVLRSAFLDYINLQHPSKRRKTEIRRAFASACDMLWDPTYQSMKMRDGEDQSMTLEDILEGAHPHNKLTPEQMRRNLIGETVRYWSEQDVRTVNIPEHVTLMGYAYHVVDKPGMSEVNFDDYLIYQDKSKGQESEREFVRLCLQLAAHHAEAKMSRVALDALSGAWFEMLRMNQCFNV